MWINILIYGILAVHVICSILLVLIVLMQRPRSEGLGAAFGSGMTESMFGAQTTDVLTKATIWLGSIFFVATLSLAILYAHRDRPTTNVGELMQTVPPTLEEKIPITPENPGEPSTEASSPTVEKAVEAQPTPPPVTP